MTTSISTDGIHSNATALIHHLIHGVNHLVQVTFIAEGKELINYKHFELNQSSKTHHAFTASFSHDSLQTEETYQMEEAQHLLGKRLLVSIRYKNSIAKPERIFSGIITQVSFEQSHGNSGYLVLKGFSPTILLDQAPHIQSFGGNNAISLQAIVSQILDEGYYQNSKYKSRIQLSKTSAISYSCQYNETAYNYLARMAEAYREPFFYDGEVLHFGKMPNQEKAIQLVYGRDVDHVEIHLHARHVNRQLYGYNSFRNERLSATEETPSEIKGTLAQAAYARSQKIFTSPSLQQAPLKATTHLDIQNVQHSVISNEGLHVFVTTGITTVPFLYPGCLVTLHMLQPDKKTPLHFTTLVITDIRHTLDALGKYEGRFEAVDAQLGSLSRIDYEQPVVEQQIATVVNNKDPHSKGRVQVRFDWQNTNQNTAFIRVMTNNAGSSAQVDANRGFVFIPEEGDQVLVNFIGNHPDRPFVLGSLFHGETAKGGGQDNHIKSIITHSGHTIQFTEEKFIEIYDTAGNHILLDTTTKSTTLSAPENLLLTAKNIQFHASENLTAIAEEHLVLHANKNIDLTAGHDYRLSARNTHAQIVCDTLWYSKKYLVSSETARIETTIDNLQLASNKEIEVLSNKKVKLF